MKENLIEEKNNGCNNFRKILLKEITGHPTLYGEKNSKFIFLRTKGHKFINTENISDYKKHVVDFVKLGNEKNVDNKIIEWVEEPKIIDWPYSNGIYYFKILNENKLIKKFDSDLNIKGLQKFEIESNFHEEV